MLAGTFTLTSSERRRFNLDCTAWLDDTEHVSSAEVTVEPATDPAFFISTIYVRGRERVVFITTGGVDDKDYVATFNIVTSDGQVRDTCVRFLVRDACGGTEPL